MKYVGSKRRFAKELLSIMLPYRRRFRYWVEPFVGGANLIDKVRGKRLGADSNPYLIACLKRLATEGTNWLPSNKSEFTEKDYNDLKNKREDFDQSLVGYVGFALSYGGKFFGGWRRDGEEKRDYVGEAYRNACKQCKNLRGIRFKCEDYQQLTIPNHSVVYCDPPYAGTQNYGKHWNPEKFWDWADTVSGTIFVSEYYCPRDNYRLVWSKSVYNSLDRNTGSKSGVENLYLRLK